jgi:hypothetical protein
VEDSNTWYFGRDAGLRFPDNTTQYTAWAGQSIFGLGTLPPTDPYVSIWYNNGDGRLYVNNDGVWIDASPTVLPPPDNNPTFESVTFNDASVQTTAWTGTYSYNDLTDKPTFVGGGGASTWLTAE